MKPNLFIIALISVLFSFQNILAQDGKPTANQQNKEQNRERMREMQTNQIVEALMLDDATATKFKPVYEKYLKELGEARTMPRKDVKNRVKGEPKTPATDAEIEKSIKDRFAQSRKMLDVREKYYTEFRKTLSPKQILKIYQQEKNNVHKFQKEFKKRHNDGKQPDRKQGDRKKS